ncbi:MAG: OmpA family protein [Campylobacterota bacterium]|nr:OmpA family protein [Campylobacterota bacterium]
MKKEYKNILLSICALAALSGCSSKSVEYDGGRHAESSAIDNKLGDVDGEESAVDSDIGTVSEIDLQSQISKSGINMIQSDIEGNSVVLSSVHFAFDKYNLNDQMRQIATDNATKVDSTIQAYNNLKIKLEGNCDEWGTDEYNYALGLKRAKTTKDALIADGIGEDRILMVSFGESNPICTEKNVGCWKLNRRVDYRLLP